MQTLSEQLKKVSVATVTDLTWANKTASFDLKDNKATQIETDGKNDCDLEPPSTLFMLMENVYLESR